MRASQILLFASAGLALAAPKPRATPLPVLLWHGLGDRFDNDGIQDVAGLIQAVHPGTQVKIIALGETGGDDQKASFLGNVTAQSDVVCNELSGDPEFAGRTVDALGFSQGGLFLRGLVERCPGISVRSLVTFGSPHNGIAQLPVCGTWDLVCKGAERAFRSNKWSDWVQGNVVPAQYYREVDEFGKPTEDYIYSSGFLADVNNERILKDEGYKKRLAQLEHFAMYLFDQDQTLLPKETAWFAEVNEETGEITELKDRPLYKEDWLGLKKLDQKGGLIFRTVKDSGHMKLTEKLLRTAFEDFFGPEDRSKAKERWSKHKQAVDQQTFQW